MSRLKLTKVQTPVLVVVCALVMAVSVIIVTDAGIPTFRAWLTGAILDVVVISAGAFLGNLLTTTREVADARETCDPILGHYSDGGPTMQPVFDYLTWTQGEHGIDVRIQFAEEVCDKLMASGELREVTAILDRPWQVEMSDKNRCILGHYQAERETKIKAATARAKNQERSHRSKDYCRHRK